MTSSRLQDLLRKNKAEKSDADWSIAVPAGLQVPFLSSESHELGEELVASYLYQVHLYHWLETNDFGRFLADNDI